MNIQVQGMAELERNSRELVNRLTYSECKEITGEAAKVVADEVRVRITDGPTRNLKRSVISKTLGRTSDKYFTTSIAAIDRKIAPHAHLIEFGTSERYQASGKSVGQVSPQPFFRPAVDSKLSEAAALIKRRLKEKLRARGR